MIWILCNMTVHVSQWVVPGHKFHSTQSRGIKKWSPSYKSSCHNLGSSWRWIPSHAEHRNVDCSRHNISFVSFYGSRRTLNPVPHRGQWYGFFWVWLFFCLVGWFLYGWLVGWWGTMDRDTKVCVETVQWTFVSAVWLFFMCLLIRDQSLATDNTVIWNLYNMNIHASLGGGGGGNPCSSRIFNSRSYVSD